MTARVENSAAPEVKTSNAFSALLDKNSDFLMENSESAALNSFEFHVPPVKDEKAPRVSGRANKASLESLMDKPKVFSSPLSSPAVPVTAAAKATTMVTETSVPKGKPPVSNDMDTTPVHENEAEAVTRPNPNAPTSPATSVEPSISDEMDLIRVELTKVSPEMAAMVERLISRMSAEIEDLKKQFFLTSNVPSKRPHEKAQSPSTAKKPPVDIAARNKSLTEAWEAKPTLNGNKRVCTDPIDDAHLNPEDDQFMVVHMSGFDLLPNEHRATPIAVLSEKFDLAPHAIINVSPIGPQLQELHIIASKLPNLRDAVAKTNGRLKISTKLDPRLPCPDNKDPNAHAECTARFRERLNREIARLSATKSRRLQSLADFLGQYRDEGLRLSAPRPRPRRMQMYASAFIDETVFDQSASESTMVTDKI